MYLTYQTYSTAHSYTKVRILLLSSNLYFKEVPEIISWVKLKSEFLVLNENMNSVVLCKIARVFFKFSTSSSDIPSVLFCNCIAMGVIIQLIRELKTGMCNASVVTKK